VLVQLRGRLQSVGVGRAKASRAAFATTIGRLGSLSPLAVLGRGYSLTRTAAGAVLRRSADVQPGAVVEVLLHDGALDARVERVKERDERLHV
jgi:exodeoxyribonuclease VII large subunit